MKKSYYAIIKTEGSFCPQCRQAAHLLTDTERQNSPAFYICFNCKYVGHVGVGPVERLNEGGNEKDG